MSLVNPACVWYVYTPLNQRFCSVLSCVSSEHKPPQDST